MLEKNLGVFFFFFFFLVHFFFSLVLSIIACVQLFVPQRPLTSGDDGVDVRRDDGEGYRASARPGRQREGPKDLLGSVVARLHGGARAVESLERRHGFRRRSRRPRRLRRRRRRRRVGSRGASHRPSARFRGTRQRRRPRRRRQRRRGQRRQEEDKEEESEHFGRGGPSRPVTHSTHSLSFRLFARLALAGLCRAGKIHVVYTVKYTLSTRSGIGGERLLKQASLNGGSNLWGRE